jgi:hypothetical protein
MGDIDPRDPRDIDNTKVGTFPVALKLPCLPS